MDLEKRKFFQQQYQDLDNEGISDLLAKQDSLVEEAISALEIIAHERKMVMPEPIFIESLNSIPVDNEAKARELWRSSLPKWLNVVFVVMFAGPVSTLRWGALPVLVAGLIGWVLSYQITKSICANENFHHEEMKAKLWEMLKGALVGWVVLTFIAIMIKG